MEYKEQIEKLLSTIEAHEIAIKELGRELTELKKRWNIK